ncbi:MAG TPA: APC family permease [Actinomycetota bacterium]|nr:APC family permease [Actinomycetota bacterium]
MAARDQRAMISERLAPVLLTTKQLGAFDLVVVFVGIVLFITNSAGLAPNGPSMFIIWILSFLTFLIPGAFVTAQLGRMFPEEGSLYVWTHKALGPFWGFFAGFLAWWPGPLVMVVAGSLVVAYARYICDFACLSQSWEQGIVILAVIAFSAFLSVLRQRVSQNYVNFQFVFYAAAIFVMGLAGLVWLWRGNPSATPFTADAWNPFRYTNLTAYSFAVLALLGIEVPLNMGVEIKSDEAIKKYLFWGPIVVMAAYLWTTWANMVAVGVPEGYDYLTGGPLGVANAMGEVLGNIVALILLWFFLSNTAIYNYSFARLLFVSGLERRLPHQIGQVNRNRVPANAVWLQTVLAALITIVMYFVFGQAAGGDVGKPYFSLLAGLTVIWCASMVLLFADVHFVRKWYPEKFEEVRQVPRWFLYLCAVVGVAADVLAAAWIFTGPWYPGGFPTTAEWNTWVSLVVLVSLVIGVAVYAISELTRKGRTEQEILGEALGGTGPAGSG